MTSLGQDGSGYQVAGIGFKDASEHGVIVCNDRSSGECGFE